MSVVQVASTLGVLRQTEWSAQQRSSVVKDTFVLIERLINAKNVHLVVRGLLKSSLWLATPPHDLAYEVMAASQYLSTTVATERSHTLLKTCQQLDVDPWRKAVLLAALFVADMRDIPRASAWLDHRGRYGGPYISALNRACESSFEHTGVPAALLVAMSFVWPKLSSFQRNKVSKRFAFDAVQALYKSPLIFDTEYDSLKANTHFRDIGILSRVVSEMLQNSSPEHLLLASGTLHAMSNRLDNMNKTNAQSVVKPLFLSLLIVQQAILTTFVRHKTYKSHMNAIGTTTLFLLRNLQGTHADNSVYESWRFCFNCALDMLDSSDFGLDTYIRQLLQGSIFDDNPLTSKSSEMYSKRRDEESARWLFLVVESCAPKIKDEKILSRVYDYCFNNILETAETQLAQSMEISHSVLLSLHTSHVNVFSRQIERYIDLVLLRTMWLNERQFRLIFATLYRLSLHDDDRQSNTDPLKILARVKSSLRNTQDCEVRDRLLRTFFDLLPIVPIDDLESQLIYANRLIQQSANEQLRQKFLETCTTQMSPDRAIVCVHFMMRQQESYEERAKL